MLGEPSLACRVCGNAAFSVLQFTCGLASLLGTLCPDSQHSTVSPREAHIADSVWREQNGALHACSRGELIPSLPTGLQACQLALSTRTVWARCPNGDLARRYGVTDKNPAGDYWKKVPGSVSCFTGRCWGTADLVSPGGRYMVGRWGCGWRGDVKSLLQLSTTFPQPEPSTGPTCARDPDTWSVGAEALSTA